MNQDFVEVTEKCLNLDDITTLVSSPSAGAISLFIGTTRDNFQDKKVLRLEYDAYIPMAKSEMTKICEQIRVKWNVVRIAMFHRIGLVPIGEASIIIAVSSVHRKESLEAVEFGIDTLKDKVPIWKKEVYEDGESEWKENNACCGHQSRQNMSLDIINCVTNDDSQ